MNRRWFKPLAAVAVALGLLVLSALVADRHFGRQAERRRLDEALAQLDADDPDWHVVGVVKAHNAAIPDDDADNVTRATFNALGWRSAAWERAMYSGKEIPQIEWDDDRLPHDNAFCSLYEVSLESGDAFRGAMAARRLPRGGLPFHFADPDPFNTLVPELQRHREAFSLFNDYATVEAYFGRGDEALRAAAASLHLCQASLSTEPTMIAQLVRIAGCAIAAKSAQRTLAWCEPNEELVPLQAAFAEAAALDGLSGAVRGERAGVLRIHANVRSGALPADYIDKFGVGVGPAPAYPWVARVLRRFKGTGRNPTRDEAESLRVMNEFVAAVRLDGPARRAACAAVKPRADSAAATALTPSVVRVVAADDLARASLRCASVALACERYRRQFGRFPASLAEIPASILPAIPTDPFSGAPLAYRPLPDGAVVYTVGPDKAFVGGQPHDPAKGPPALRIHEFRLWNVEARRRPPTPRPEKIDVEPALPGDAP